MISNTIKLSFRGSPGTEIEGIAASDIQPGMNLTIDTDGKYLPHNVLEGFSMPWVAVEDPVDGGYERSLDQSDYYKADGRVYVIVPKAGDMMWMLLEPNIDTVIGDQLLSAGPGTPAGMLGLGSGPFTAGAVVAIAREAITGEVGVVKRIKVEIAK